MTIEEIKKSVNLAEYIRNRCNVEFITKGKELLCKCPFPDHHDGKPSFSVNIDKNLFQCFGCARKGSIIDFVKDYDNLSLAETLKKLSLNNKNLPSSFSAGTAENTASRASTERKNDNLLSLSPVAEFYHKTLFGKDSKGLEYLKKRNITDIETLKHFQAGYVNGTLLKTLSAKQKKALNECGLITENGTEFFLGCVVFPMLNDQSEVVSFYGRKIENGTFGAHFYLPGSRTGLINAKSAKVYDNIVLTESVIDAVSAFQAGVKNVIPCYGTNGFTSDHEKLLCTSKLSGGSGRKPIIIVFDNDIPGKNNARQLVVQLKEKGVTACSASLPDEVKDVNDFFAYNREFDCRRTAEEFKQLIISAEKELANLANRKPESAKFAGSELQLIKHNSSELVYGIDDVIYKLRGLYLNSLTSLKLVVTASPAEGNKKRLASSITDRFDLYLARNRKSFAYRVQEKLDRPVSRVENDLDKLIPQLEVLREEHRKPSDSKDDKSPVEISSAEKKEALTFLRSPQLLKRITADIETVGYVGEDTAKLLVYLIATSRKLAKPQSCIIRSESGSGKSFLMECVAELMPNEDVEFFSRLTPQSLYYMDRDRLKHKLLIVDERDGSDDAEYSIRTLQTRRKLTLAVPMKNDRGEITTIEKVINGPIAYMESTTAQNINPENANRCFEIFLDESSEQTLRVFQKQRDIRTLSGWKQDLKRQDVTNLHQNAQRLLKNVKVIIPYVNEIKFPSNWMRNRRDHDRFLCLIEAVAFLHQYQRERKSTDKEEYIEANLDDYETAYNLALTVFTSSHHDLPKNTLGVFFQLKKMVEEKAKEQKIRVGELWFRRRELREYSKLQDHQLKRTLRTLTDLEYLNVKRSGNGGTYHYRLTGTITNPDVMKGVTTPAQLRRVGIKNYK